MPESADSHKSKRRQTSLITFVVVLALAALCFHTFISDQTLRFLVLHSESANPDVVEDLLHARRDPAPLLWQLWHTRKISQRQEVLAHLNSALNTDLPGKMSALIHEAALDPDANLRELALGILQAQKDPQLRDLARAQLQDADPQIRILGIQYLRSTGDASLTPVFLGLLADPEPSVAVTADAALRRWTGNDFGLRMVSVVPDLNGDPKSLDDPGKIASIHANADKWHSWWQTNESNYGTVPSLGVAFPTLDQAPLAGNFALQDLNGRTVHLADFKGKTVLLNFWTTWCTACQEEMPRLVELQKRHPDLAIISVSLDGAPLDDDEDAPLKPSDLDASSVRKKIDRLVQTRGINYQILLDPQGTVGGRFNGNELPTNVLIDSAGRVRRRFIGARSVPALEAMLNDIANSK